MSQATMTYPTEEQHSRWKENAEKHGMSLSEYIQAMVEAGQKKFEVDGTPDETKKELRRQRNDLREQLEIARERIEQLERENYTTEREQIRSFVRENPGVTFSDVVNHVNQKSDDRVNDHLEAMNGQYIRFEGDEIYPEGTDEN